MQTSEPRGASTEELAHFARIAGWSEILPVASDPSAQVSERSTLKDIGKVPSLFDAGGRVYGLHGWPRREPTEAEVRRWFSHPNISLGLQCRTIRAFDIDSPRGPEIAAQIKALLGFDLPTRYRDNSGRRLLAFRYKGRLPKRVIKLADGAIELLGDGQFFVAAGTHQSGARLRWEGGMPNLPVLTNREVGGLC